MKKLLYFVACIASFSAIEAMQPLQPEEQRPLTGSQRLAILDARYRNQHTANTAPTNHPQQPTVHLRFADSNSSLDDTHEQPSNLRRRINISRASLAGSNDTLESAASMVNSDDSDDDNTQRFQPSTRTYANNAVIQQNLQQRVRVIPHVQPTIVSQATGFPPYIPAKGPVQLGDTLNPQARTITDGAIMAELFKEENREKLGLLCNFYNTRRAEELPSYQEIMTDLKNPRITSQEATKVIEMFELIIMGMYDDKAYYCGGYTPGMSMFTTGIRKNLFHSENDKVLNQYLDELNELAAIAAVHNSLTAFRLRRTIDSYRNWKTYLGIACLTYLAADTLIQGSNYGMDRTTLGLLWSGGLRNTPAIAANVPSNAIHTMDFFTNWIIGPTLGWLFGMKNKNTDPNGPTNYFCPTRAEILQNLERSNQRHAQKALQDELFKKETFERVQRLIGATK